MPRSSSAVWLTSKVVTVERSFKSVEQCKYYDVHRNNHIISPRQYVYK